MWGTHFLALVSPDWSSETCPPGPKACEGTDLAVPLLRVNDWLLRINDVDLINKDKKQAIKALLNGEGAINMVVRRRKSLGGKVITPLHINLSGHKGSGPAEVGGAPRMAGSPSLEQRGCVRFWVCGSRGTDAT